MKLLLAAAPRLLHLPFPPLRDGGPIEAASVTGWSTTFGEFPPLRDGGPIEAVVEEAISMSDVSHFRR